MSLQQTLEQKPLFYASIDVKRMPNAYEIFKNHLKIPRVIHIVGTNGKGSTGRFLALMLKQAKRVVGHYTSPHIKEFNERFWLDGRLVNNKELELAHDRLKQIFPQDVLKSLSYFEYATFLAATVFEHCDEVILEAGLGGEWDATNVFPKKLSIITPIGLDHQSFLGNTIQEIASTKLRSMQTTTLINENQNPTVIQIAKDIAKEREISLVNVLEIIDARSMKEIEQYTKKHSYPDFLKENIMLSFGAARLLHVKPKISYLPPLDLRGRFEWIEKNVLLDCGHNEMAAKVLVNSLKEKRYDFIYNAYKDKDFKTVLKILKPKIDSLHVIPMGDENRASAQDEIVFFAKKNGIIVKKFDFTLNKEKKYVVFGSFGVIEAFLKGMYAQ